MHSTFLEPGKCISKANCILNRFNCVFILIKLHNATHLYNCYFFRSTRDEIRLPVFPPNWNVGVGITLRRQNSESIQIKTVRFVTIINISGVV
jgi:hypothetical protein